MSSPSTPTTMNFQHLPVELIAEVLANLDVPSLITASYLSKRLYLVASDSALNPWRRPILANLRAHNYDQTLKHLSVRSTVPRQNFIEILSLARPPFLLFEATLPNLKSCEWEECFTRRFPPSWQKWRKDGSWKEAFLKVLFRVWHRGATSCTTDEAWTKYIVLNRNGSANLLEAASRSFNPIAIFNQMKYGLLSESISRRNGLVPCSGCRAIWLIWRPVYLYAFLPPNLIVPELSGSQSVVEFADFRILALGTMTIARSPASINVNAHLLLNPPGMEPPGLGDSPVAPFYSPISWQRHIDDHGVYPVATTSDVSPISQVLQLPFSSFTYSRLTHPFPAAIHSNYPFHTPGGADARWLNQGEIREGSRWVGGFLITAQLLGPSDGRQYASFNWSDLWTIAPWLEDIITKRIDGQGLGH